MIKKNAIYICSTNEQEINRQTDAIKNYLNDSEVEVYIDNTLDDYKKAGYVALTIDIQFNKIDKVFVTSLESLTVNILKLESFCKILSKFGVELIIINPALSADKILVQSDKGADNSQRIMIDDWDDDDGYDDEIVDVIINKMLNNGV